jgi:hypothetical protein
VLGKWPSVLVEHPAVCEDPAVVLRLLATSRALGASVAAAATGRLRLTLECKGRCAYDPPERRSKPEGLARRRLCCAQAAFVERRGALLAELALADGSAWDNSDYETVDEDRPIERVLAPALQRAAAAGRLAGLRAVEAPAFRLEGFFLRALALCPALTRLRIGTYDYQTCNEVIDLCAYIGDGTPSAGQLRAFGRQLAALRGLRELELAFGCEARAAPAMAGLSALTRLTRLRLSLLGLMCWGVGQEGIELSRWWSGLHSLPASLLDLTLAAYGQVGAGARSLAAGLPAGCEWELAGGGGSAAVLAHARAALVGGLLGGARSVGQGPGFCAITAGCGRKAPPHTSTNQRPPCFPPRRRPACRTIPSPSPAASATRNSRSSAASSPTSRG